MNICLKRSRRSKQLKFGTTIPSKCIKISLGDLGGIVESQDNKGLKRKVKVKMSCTAYVIVDEDVQGNMEIEDVEDIEDIEDFDVIQTD